MPVERQSEPSGTFKLSDTRASSIDSLRNCELDAPGSEEHIREAITKMGFLDRIVDRLFHDSAKHGALNAIADLFIANRKLEAANLSIEAAEELKEKRDTAGKALLRAAHAEGLNSLMKSYETTVDGGRLTVKTEQAGLDRLLAFTVSREEFADFIRGTNGLMDAALAYRDWARTAETPEMKAHLHAREAQTWATSENHNDAMKAWDNCAQACEERGRMLLNQALTTATESAASYRARAKAFIGAATAWNLAADSAQKSRWPDDAAYREDMANKSERLANTYSKIADALDATPDKVDEAHCHKLEAQALMDVSEYTRAMDAWEKYHDACHNQASDFLKPLTLARATGVSLSTEFTALSYQNAAKVLNACADTLEESAQYTEAKNNTDAAAALRDMAQGTASQVHRLTAQMRTETMEYDLALDSWGKYAQTCLERVSGCLHDVSEGSSDYASKRYQKAATITQGASRFLEAAADQATRSGRTLEAPPLRKLAHEQKTESYRCHALSHMAISKFDVALIYWNKLLQAGREEASSILSHIATKTPDDAGKAYHAAAQVSRRKIDALTDAITFATRAGNAVDAGALADMKHAQSAEFHLRQAQGWTMMSEDELAIDSWEKYRRACDEHALAQLNDVEKMAPDDAANAYRAASSIMEQSASDLVDAAESIPLLRAAADNARALADGYQAAVERLSANPRI